MDFDIRKLIYIIKYLINGQLTPTMLNVFLFSLLFLWSAHAFVREISSGKETSVVRIGTPEIDIESHRISFSVDAPFLDHTWAGSEEFSDYDDYFATYRNTTSPKLYDTNVVVEERVPFPVTDDTSGLHILCYCEDNTDSACSVNHTHGVVAHVFGDVLEVSYVRSDIDGLLRTFCELPDEEYWNTLSANVRNDSPMFVRTDSFEFGDAMIPVVISNEGISFQGMLMTRVDNKPPFVRSVLPDFLTGGMSDGTFVACQQSLLIETPAGDRVHFPRNGGHPLSTSDADLALTFVNATITYESDDTIQITAAPGNELEGVFPIKNMTMGSFYRTHADFCAIETTSPLTMVPLDRFGSVDEVIEIVQVLRHPIAMQYFDLYPSLEETTTLPIPRTIANVGTCASSFVTINDIHKIKKDRVFSETQFSDGVDGYDDWLRLTMNDMSVYVTQSSPSNQLFSDDGDHITYTGFPTALRTAPLLHKPQNDSFITQTTTYSDAEGRHMIKLHMESSLEDLSRCKFRNEDGFLQDVVTVDDESESDWIFYSFYPTWMQLYPRRLNGLPGARNTYSKEFSIGVSKTSRSTQVVDSGRDMFAQIISVRGEVGPVKGCPADDQGRLTFEIELTHAKNNPDDNNEVIGVYDIAHVTKYGDDCYDFPTSDQTLASERQSISQPNCPMNSPFCYQILQLTTSCRQLSIEGTAPPLTCI